MPASHVQLPRRLLPLAALTAAAAALWLPAPLAALQPVVLRAIAGIPPHIVGSFEDVVGFQQAPSGVYYVLDRRGHRVHTIDPERTASRVAVDIGQEDGRVIMPSGFDVSPDGGFVVADSPRGRQRIQTFNVIGDRRTAFFLPGAPAAHITFGGLVLNGVSAVRTTGRSLLISQPESGRLFNEYDDTGHFIRGIGQLRASGFEDDREVHLAMNAGLPLIDPTGGFFYVFLSGQPVFRKYDSDGMLMFERVMQGAEIEPILAAQPTTWPRRRIENAEIPLVQPIIRAAAVDPRGHLWVALALPYTYVFDNQGDKVRVVQFSAAGTLNPTSLSFTHDGRLLATPGCYEFAPEYPE